MDGSLVHLVNDPCTPASMASANVPLDVALWYHTQGRRMVKYNEEELRQVLAVRSLVRTAVVA
jgi:hypothetical protein